MDCLVKLEDFFSQLQYGLAVDSDSMLITEDGFHRIMLSPSQFLQVKSVLKFDYPFLYKKKSIEIVQLAKNESISSEYLIECIQELKTQYWFSPPSIDERIINNIQNVFKKANPEITPNKLFKEIVDYQNFIEEKRNSYLNYLVDLIKKDNYEDEFDIIKQEEINELESMIDESLLSITNSLVNDLDYEILKKQIILFVGNGRITLKKPLLVNNGSRKKIAKSMGNFYRTCYPHKMFNYQYFRIYPKLFNCFSDYEIDETEQIHKTKLYKYSR
jgi:hypothetical protein